MFLFVSSMPPKNLVRRKSNLSFVEFPPSTPEKSSTDDDVEEYESPAGASNERVSFDSNESDSMSALNIVEIFDLPPLVTQANVEHAIKLVKNINKTGPMKFSTEDSRGNLAETTGTGLLSCGEGADAFTNGGINKMGEFPKSYTFQGDTWETRLYFRTYREFLWQRIPLQWEGQSKCGIIARLERKDEPRPVRCCAGIQQQYLDFQKKWDSSATCQRFIKEVLRSANSARHIDRIVCYDLGNLGTAPVGQPNYRCLVQHFLAFTVARVLNEYYGLTGENRIALFAEDSRYCPLCVRFLRDEIGEAHAHASGFTIVNDWASFTPPLLNAHTLLVTFAPRGYVLAPVIDMLLAQHGPAALLCNDFEDSRGTEDEPENVSADSPLIDSSPALWQYKQDSVEKGHNWFLDFRSELCMRKMLGVERLGRFRPVMYRAPGEEGLDDGVGFRWKVGRV
jgi:hypothetical protein